MRAGIDPSWLILNDVLVGFSFGADFTAEHEWGIKDLNRLLGVPSSLKIPGLPRRTISKTEAVHFHRTGNAAALLCWQTYLDGQLRENLLAGRALSSCLPQDLKAGGKLRAAWDGGSFGIYAEGEEVDRLEELWKALQKNNAALWIGGKVIAFENGGLILCIVDRVPKDKADLMVASDKDHEALMEASLKTGILERLEKAGRRFYACSPRWLNKDLKSTHPVMYWLNPAEQDANNYGWYTVEQLDQWILGKGPIPKKLRREA